MKLMKHITIALVLCAIPAMAFGQTSVSCDDCTHAVSVYMGEGGFIAMADGAEMVTWVATCGGVTRSGELAANADGMVSALFSMDNGLACMMEGDGNMFELGPIMDGGWFWITRGMNSAVGNLVDMDILENDMVELTSAGTADVSMMTGRGAVLVEQASTGRVGILPNILPEPPVAALRLCGYDVSGTTYKRRASNCALGNGGTMTLATTTNSFTGATTVVANGATITRPAGVGEIVVVIDLWANGTGHFTTAADGDARLGHPAFGMGDARAMARLTGVTYSAKMGSGPSGGDFVAGDALAGITMTAGAAGAGTPDVDTVTFTVKAAATHCSATNNYPVPVAVTAMLAEASATQTTPARTRHATTDAAGGTKFTVVCPAASSSANMGEELVPDNPFPTDK